MDISKLYASRFSKNDLTAKDRIWKVLTKDFFQQWVNLTDTVVDIGAGYCEFINNINCQHKIAVDVNPDINQYAASGVVIVGEKSTNIQAIPDNSVQVVFMSNFLEHLRSKEEILQTFHEVQRILVNSGKAIILQPNIRYLSKQYWDFFDHHMPLSDVSLCEGLHLSGFSILKNYPKFLPYTTKSKLPQHPFLVRMYLKFPILWKLFGKQCCVIGVKGSA